MKINTIIFVLSVFSIILLVGCSTPDVSPSNTSTPNVSITNVSTPDVSSSNTSTPDISTPDISTPDVSKPNVSISNTTESNTSIPDVTKPNTSKPKACTAEAKICPDGSAVGRIGPNCDFQECPQLQINLKANECIADERGRECPEEYIATCGWFNQSIKCLKYPCAVTYANSCEACNDEKVDYWTQGPCPRTDAELQTACVDAGGDWVSSSKECEGISQTQCNLLNGEFNECASACRNNPDADMCTLQCVLVCKFKNVVS